MYIHIQKIDILCNVYKHSYYDCVYVSVYKLPFLLVSLFPHYALLLLLIGRGRKRGRKRGKEGRREGGRNGGREGGRGERGGRREGGRNGGKEGGKEGRREERGSE